MHLSIQWVQEATCSDAGGLLSTKENHRDHGDRTEESFPWDMLRLGRTLTENVCLQNVLNRVSMGLELGGVWRRQLRS